MAAQRSRKQRRSKQRRSKQRRTRRGGYIACDPNGCSVGGLRIDKYNFAKK